MRHALFALALFATPAWAETPMTATEFETFSTGRTFTFGNSANPYGIERYHNGRRVTWAFLGEDCQEGVWFPDGDNICFDYGDGTPVQCWQFFDEGETLRARFMNDPANNVEYRVREAEIPLICPNLGA